MQRTTAAALALLVAVGVSGCAERVTLPAAGSFPGACRPVEQDDDVVVASADLAYYLGSGHSTALVRADALDRLRDEFPTREPMVDLGLGAEDVTVLRGAPVVPGPMRAESLARLLAYTEPGDRVLLFVVRQGGTVGDAVVLSAVLRGDDVAFVGNCTQELFGRELLPVARERGEGAGQLLLRMIESEALADEVLQRGPGG